MRSPRSTGTVPDPKIPVIDIKSAHEEVVRTVASLILLDLKCQKSTSDEDTASPTESD